MLKMINQMLKREVSDDIPEPLDLSWNTANINLSGKLISLFTVILVVEESLMAL